tara:strand:+ start:230 stop:676 length:447 start_codon:yes stop_codon:yes gene_type:complete
MGTLIDILLGFLLFMFTAVSLTMVCGWLILQFVGIRKEEECGCQTCECDDEIPMLDRPLTKKELKEVNMEEQNKEYNIMTARDMMTMKTEVKQTASPENINKSYRGISYKEDNERMDIIGQNGNDGLHYEELKNREPLEENNPNPPKK